MIAAPPHTVVERALVARLSRTRRDVTSVRCGDAWLPGTRTSSGGRGVVCIATRRHNVTEFYTAVRWASDGRWHFVLVGAVA